jgi:hypothetical protein
MKNQEFRAWKDRLRLSFAQVAADLGIGQSTAKAYAAKFAIPRFIELCIPSRSLIVEIGM